MNDAQRCAESVDLVKLVKQKLDPDEQAFLLFTLRAIASYKSKGAKTRRWREFEQWFTERRANKATA